MIGIAILEKIATLCYFVRFFSSLKDSIIQCIFSFCAAQFVHLGFAGP